MRAFVKHTAALSWCAVDDTSGGSIHTLCRGRMALTDEYEIHDNPPEHERCGGCVRRLADLERIDAGLKELARAIAGHGTEANCVVIPAERVEAARALGLEVQPLGHDDAPLYCVHGEFDLSGGE